MENNEPPLPFLLRNKKKNTPRKQTDVRSHLDHSIRTIHDIIRRKNITQNQKPIQFQIPNLNNQLVTSYIKEVYADYSITDPLESRPPSSQKTQKQKRTSPMNSTNKKAIKLKENFISEMMNSMETHISPQIKSCLNHEFLNSGGKVPEIYRYCFICEEQILQVNIGYHEKEKCPQFSALYQMNLEELHECLALKIKRLKERLRENLELLKNKDNFQTNRERTISSTETYLEDIQENDESRLRNKYRNCMKAYNNEYFDAYENIRRLQWFMVMEHNLSKNYLKKQNQQCTQFLLSSDKYL